MGCCQTKLEISDIDLYDHSKSMICQNIQNTDENFDDLSLDSHNEYIFSEITQRKLNNNKAILSRSTSQSFHRSDFEHAFLSFSDHCRMKTLELSASTQMTQVREGETSVARIYK